MVLVYYVINDIINHKHDCSYIDSPGWIKKKRATRNPKSNDNKCFQYAATITLNYEKIKWNPERILNIKLFIKKYNWDKIKYL